MVMECGNIDLNSWLKKKKTVKPSERKYYWEHMLEAVHTIHQHGIFYKLICVCVHVRLLLQIIHRSKVLTCFYVALFFRSHVKTKCLALFSQTQIPPHMKWEYFLTEESAIYSS